MEGVLSIGRSRRGTPARGRGIPEAKPASVAVAGDWQRTQRAAEFIGGAGKTQVVVGVFPVPSSRAFEDGKVLTSCLGAS